VRVYTSLGANRRIPNVVGINESDAVKLIESVGITGTTVEYKGCDVLGTVCDTIAPGQVVSSTPEIGILIPDGTTIVLTVRQP